MVNAIKLIQEIHDQLRIIKSESPIAWLVALMIMLVMVSIGRNAKKKKRNWDEYGS